MRINKKYVLSFVLGVLLSLVVQIITKDNKVPKNDPILSDTAFLIKSCDWDKMIDAIIYVESRGDSLAVNKRSGATGVLQLMPIYVKQCNEIVGYQKYDLDDRFSRQKSIEMFNVYQSWANPTKDFGLAILTHHPNQRITYYKAILTKYNELI